MRRLIRLIIATLVVTFAAPALAEAPEGSPSPGQAITDHPSRQARVKRARKKRPRKAKRHHRRHHRRHKAR